MNYAEERGRGGLRMPPKRTPLHPTGDALAIPWSDPGDVNLREMSLRFPLESVCHRDLSGGL